jgi:hypothetical protein
LERLLDHVTGLGPAVWRASLGDVAGWWGRQHAAGEEQHAVAGGSTPGRWPGAAVSAFVLSGDIDAITLWDYAARLFGR